MENQSPNYYNNMNNNNYNLNNFNKTSNYCKVHNHGQLIQTTQTTNNTTENNNNYIPENRYYTPPTNYNQLLNHSVNSDFNNNNINNINQNNLVNNQTTQTQKEVEFLSIVLKSDSKFVCCPYCKNDAMTKTKQKTSIPNFLCFLATGPIAWLGFQVLRKKDLNCYDSDHYCTKCKNVMASYRAC
jgi:hypothetical protein